MAKVAYKGVGDWGHPIYSGEVYQCSCNGIFYGFDLADGSFVVCDQTGFPVFSLSNVIFSTFSTACISTTAV